MNDAKLEALLLGARPSTHGQYTQLTRRVMDDIKQRGVLESQLSVRKRPARKLFVRLRALHGAGLAMAILVSVALLGGVAYASVRFVPDFIRILDKKLNSIGRIEYSAPGFADCYEPGRPSLNTFEVKPSAGLSDADVEKTLRAKCELMGRDTFANDTWPTYGERAGWKTGDTIFYARPDRIGRVQQITEQSVTLEYGNGEESKTYTTFERKQLEAYARGEKVSWRAIKPGDVVFNVVRVSETYIEAGDRDSWTQDDTTYMPPSDAQPKVRGVVAVVRLALPERYYTELQKHVYEVQPCVGNTDERCPSGGGVGVAIDVFPRGSEGTQNPSLSAQRVAEGQAGREIAGVVSVIQDGQFTITARSGNKYVVGMPKSVMDSYNAQDAPGYVPSLTSDIATVQFKEGSWVSLLYSQAPGADHKSIQEREVVRLMLLTDASPKGGKL